MLRFLLRWSRVLSVRGGGPRLSWFYMSSGLVGMWDTTHASVIMCA